MMKKILFILISVSSLFLSAQSFPYLNASSGNSGEFPVDKDTNIYMFHGNRLSKTDKNFNIIWANTYSGLTFSNILLSKTGPLYFIAGTIIGRIESNGTLAWCKDLLSIPTASGTYNFFYSTTSLNSLLLDHNNNLIVTGNVSNGTNYAYYLKTDTNGNALKLLPFTGVFAEKPVITQDSAGYYRFFSTGWIPKFDFYNEFGFMIFNDATNSFLSNKYIMAFTSDLNTTWKDCHYMRSRLNNNFYIHIGDISENGYFPRVGLIKYKKDGTPLWRLELRNLQNNYGSGYPTGSQFPTESSSGDILLGLVTNTNTNLSAFKIDSNGVTNNSGVDLLTSNATFTAYVMPYHHHPHSMQTIYGNKYYEDIDSNSYFNPLIISNFTTTAADSCHSLATCNSTLFTSNIPQAYSTPTVRPITSFTINSYTSTVSPVSFSTSFKYCTIHDTITDIGIIENERRISELKLFPNPVKNKLNIEWKCVPELSEIEDLTGKILIKTFHSSEIDVGKLSPGLYFLKLRSGTTICTSKFIKE